MQLSRNAANNALLLHPRENLTATGNLGSVNAEIIADADGCSSFALDLRGTFSQTVEVSGTVDGFNWTLIPVKSFAGSSFGPYLASIAGAVAGVYVGPVGPYRRIRARVTAYTSGSAVAVLMASNASLPPDAFDASTFTATIAGAAGAAVTLTLPAPGANLRHYLQWLRVDRFAAALLTAGATPVVATTTNLPGALAISIAAEAAAAGSSIPYLFDFPAPIQSSAQNTATTIVLPITTSVLWRVTAGYQVRP
jgi:hypothetical protein